MDELIEALQIMRRHTESRPNPTHCEHDELSVFVDDVRKFSHEEKKWLDELGFFLSGEDFYVELAGDDEENEVEWYEWDLAALTDDDIGDHRFVSYRFGSC